MRRWVVPCVLAAFVGFSATTISASSQPTLSGTALGIELCPQFICGFALFAGQFQGEVNGRPAAGWFSAAITHDDLPVIPGGVSAITGGTWTIGTNRRLFRGSVAEGTLYNVDGTRYCVTMAMPLTTGGHGEVYFSGLLDHNPFPPTIAGFVTQDPPSTLCPTLP